MKLRRPIKSQEMQKTIANELIKFDSESIKRISEIVVEGGLGESGATFCEPQGSHTHSENSIAQVKRPRF